MEIILTEYLDKLKVIRAKSCHSTKEPALNLANPKQETKVPSKTQDIPITITMEAL